MREINSQNCVVVFLDIMGYSSWVEEVKSPDIIFTIFENILKDIQLMKEKHPNAQEYFDLIEVTIWSDSLIYVIDLDKIKDNTQAFISWFLYFLSLSTIKFISDSGYFLRGAIHYGDFLQRKILSEEHRFIFSQAYIVAVDLEKKADVPRIILSKEFIEFAERRDLFDRLTRLSIQQDMYQQYYLDYYFWFHKIPGDGVKKTYLTPIKDKISRKWLDVKEDKIRWKFCYFIDYHNRHVMNMFRPCLLDRDFESLGIKQDEVLILLRDLGILEDTGDFFIKRDVPPDVGAIMRTLSYARMSGEKMMQLATLLRQRISECNDLKTKYSICNK